MEEATMEQATATEQEREAADAIDEALRQAQTRTDLAVRDDSAGEGFRRAERVFTEPDRAAIASFLNVGEDDPALVALLAVAAQLGLNPLLGEVWLIPVRMKVRNAEGKKEWQDRYRVAVGRDGLLKAARRSKGKRNGYRGLQYGVVHEHDSFEVQYGGDFENDPKVLHRFAMKPTEFEGGVDPTRYRGRIVGAWAKLYVDGEPAHFYFANLREHGRTREDDAGNKSWDGAWGYTSGMVLKSAQSYVLRLGLGVTGIVPVDEMGNPDRIDEDRTAAAPAAEEQSFDWDDAVADEELRGRLRAAVASANEQEPGSWLPAKCEMVFSGRSEPELRQLAESIEVENVERAARAARAAEVVDGEAVEEPAPEPGQPPEPTPADEGARSDAGVAEKVRGLELRRQELVERRAVAQSDREEEELTAEIDTVDGELRSLRGDAPGQSSLNA